MFSVVKDSGDLALRWPARLWHLPLIAETDAERLTQRWLLLALIALLLGIAAVYLYLRRRQDSKRK